MGMVPTNTTHREILSVFNFDGETPASGLVSGDFTPTFLYEDSIATPSSFSVVEIPNSGRYVVSMSFPTEGFWTAFIDVSIQGSLLSTHQINIKVSNSESQISIQGNGESLNNVGTLNFTGDVVLTEDAGVATIKLQASPPAHTGTSDSSEVPIHLGGADGTLTFESRTI